jgi:hypothetical protein
MFRPMWSSSGLKNVGRGNCLLLLRMLLVCKSPQCATQTRMRIEGAYNIINICKKRRHQFPHSHSNCDPSVVQPVVSRYTNCAVTSSLKFDLGASLEKFSS